MWKAAMFEEMRALIKNGTWEIIPRSAGKKTVGCKWVFIVKHNPEGKVDRLKATLVVNGYTQTYGIDYEETFAPVTKMNTVCTLISCAVNFGWNIDQLDVNNAFLHRDFKEEVYIELHSGFDNGQVADKVCRLKCSLYGLKQSPELGWIGS
jgi:Reverse transcriptase (RNA-dependent DNA polymerase)